MSALSGADLQGLCSPEKKNLADIQDLLNCLFVRNKNQHRRSHWFKSLHQFRKQLGLMINEVEGKTAAAARLIEERLRFWDVGCVHKWYLHFTQLVAVGPFAVLGLVLMASVARVCKITGITAHYEEIASEDMKRVMAAIDSGLVTKNFGGLLEDEATWDEGEVVVREE
ncbi:hypothetical protein P280DRAFT_67453 [Massarina eburnea CBS 473.64]|uniref:RNase MRP protein 1 RNA binding domain-containing protein n=1 Tax=Massarina eburnea CBS 473.64 TaxID=1395130 RepID=A0A6A6RW25_9PLEO|nr:hypothetical protein P280DRAFT_67453 [Massarina eburnea CBS 473.64]